MIDRPLEYHPTSRSLRVVLVAAVSKPTSTPRAVKPPPVAAPGGGFDCIRRRESHDNYEAVNPNGHYGAYQFSQTTWDGTAARHGRDDLEGVRPDHASPADQDLMARWLQADAGWGQWSTHRACGL